MRQRLPDRIINPGGYVLLYVAGIGRVSEHRYVLELHMGRRLRKSEHVHHIDRNKQNNDISNLTIMTSKEHSRLHAIEDDKFRKPKKKRNVKIRKSKKVHVVNLNIKVVPKGKLPKNYYYIRGIGVAGKHKNMV